MWLEIIYRVITTPRFDLKKGDLNYVLLNMLAKHTSSADCYYVSEGVKTLIMTDAILSHAFAQNAPANLRKLFYGKESRAAHLGHPTMFEHSIPTAVLRNELLLVRQRYVEKQISQNDAHNETKKILENCGEVIIVLKEENKRLAKSSMPTGWEFGRDCPFARYDAANPPVKISNLLAYRDESICR